MKEGREGVVLISRVDSRRRPGKQISCGKYLEKAGLCRKGVWANTEINHTSGDCTVNDEHPEKTKHCVLQ